MTMPSVSSDLSSLFTRFASFSSVSLFIFWLPIFTTCSPLTCATSFISGLNQGINSDCPALYSVADVFEGAAPAIVPPVARILIFGSPSFSQRLRLPSGAVFLSFEEIGSSRDEEQSRDKCNEGHELFFILFSPFFEDFPLTGQRACQATFRRK